MKIYAALSRKLFFYLSSACFLLTFLLLPVHSQIITEYLQDLRYGVPNVRARAAEKISQTKNSKYTQVIIDALQDPDAEVRISAAQGLWTLQADEALLDLVNALADSSGKARAEIRGVIIKFNDVEFLKKHLREHANSQVREQIAIIFGEMKEISAVPILIEALNDNDFVRFAAMKSLGQIGDETAVRSLINTLNDPLGELKMAAARSLMNMKAYNAVPDMFELLNDKEMFVRNEITEMLDGLLSSTIVLYYTEALLKNKSANIRQYCARALGMLGDTSTIPVLLETLADKKKNVREEAFASLKRLMNDSSVFSLSLMLDDKDIKIRTYAVNSIRELGNPLATPGLLALVEDERNDELLDNAYKTVLAVCDVSVSEFFVRGLDSGNRYVRKCCAEAIGKLKLPDLLSPLLRAYEHEKRSEVKMAMLTTMKDIGHKMVLPILHKELVEEKSIDIRIAIIVVLQDFTVHESIPPLLECLKVGDDLLTLQAEELLNKISDERSIKYFSPVLKEKNIVVRAYAMKVIKKFPTSEVLPLAMFASHDKDVLIRREAVELLGIIGDKLAMDELVQRINDKEEEVRVRAIIALGQLGDPGVTVYAMDALKDKSSSVRYEVVKLLRKYGDETIIPPLITRIKKEEDLNTRKEIIEIFDEFNAVAAIPALERVALKDIEPSLRKASIKVIGKLADTSIIDTLKKIFTDDFSSDVKAEAMIALAQLGAKEMMPEFMNMLKKDNKSIREAAYKALDTLIDESDTSYLVNALKTGNTEIRDFCLETLSRFKSKNALGELFNLVKIKDSTRSKVMQIIDSSADQTTVPYYIELMDDPAATNDTELQLWVIGNIGRFKARDGIDYLLETLRNENYTVREAAVKALGQIRDRGTIKWLSYIAENDTSFSVRVAAKDALKNFK